MSLVRGTIATIRLDPTLGHEQGGARPCIVVSAPQVADQQRYAILCVVPLTGTPLSGALYPPIAPGMSGLRKVSYALVDQVRSIDKRRILATAGTVTADELAALDLGLRLFLAL